VKKGSAIAAKLRHCKDLARPGQAKMSAVQIEDVFLPCTFSSSNAVASKFSPRKPPQ